MNAHPSVLLVGLVAAAAITLLTVRCDARLQPYADETGLFSIYGYLTVSDGPHYIRVKNLNDLVLDDSTEPLDATVTPTHVETGTTETLTDTVVSFDGLFTYNFRSDMEIEPGATYAVTVERSDGRTGRATATMPPTTEVRLSTPIENACHKKWQLEFPAVDNSRFVEAAVGMRYADTLAWHDLELTELFEGGLRNRFTPASFVDEIVPPNVTPIVDCDPTRYCNLLDERSLRIAYTHFGPDWPADSTLADPLTSDVTNGTGVFAGLRRDTLRIATNAQLRCPGPEPVPCSEVARPCTSGESCRCPDV